MDDLSANQTDEDLAELLDSFRWTQALAQKLVRDPAAAADLSQDAWTLAVQRFGNKVPGQAWFQATIRSIAFRTRRSSKRRRRYEAEGAEPRFADGALDVLMRSEAQQHVARAVDNLPMDLRIAVLLRFQECLSIAAIAERLDCPTSTASDRVQRGLAQVRSALGANAGAWETCLALAGPLGAIPLPAPLQAQGMALGAGLHSGLDTGLKAGASAVVDISRAPSSALATYLPLPFSSGIAVKKLVLIGSLIIAALLGLGVFKVSRIAPGPRADLETASPHALVALRTPGEEALSPASLDPPPTERRKNGTALTSTASPEDFVLTASVVDDRGRPVPKPRMVAATEVQRWEVVGTEDGSVELRLRKEDLAQMIHQDIEVTLAGGLYQTLWVEYIDANGASELAPPYPGGHGDLGTITLQPAGAIRGRAASSTGEPVAGAAIGIYRYDPNEPKRYWGYSGPAPEVLTDKDGRFLMGHILPGAFLMGAQHPEYTRGSPTSQVTVDEGATAGPLLLTAFPAAAITGRVLDRTGHPVEGVRLNATNRWGPDDTNPTGPDGAFRILLRGDNPARVWTSFPGWRRISPAEDERFGPCELTIVMEPELAPADFAVRVVCAESQENLYRVGVTVMTDPKAEESAILSAASSPFDSNVQPVSGIPVDLVPGRDRLLLQATGYMPKLVPTFQAGDSAPHITAMLERSPGVYGRLLEDGRPIPGARVILESVGVRKAHPREFLREGRAYRSPPELSVPPWSFPTRGAGRESVLGLDGNPPAFRHAIVAPEGGARTDKNGFFKIRDHEDPVLALVLRREGRADRVLRVIHVESRSMDLGDVEVAPAATLSGRFEFSGVWSPGELAVAAGDPEREVPLEEDGSFTIVDLQPGPIHFSLTHARRGGGSSESATKTAPFEDTPIFQVDLAPAEDRQVVISLDPYAPANFELEVTIGGVPAPDNCQLELAPLDQPDRQFCATCSVELGLMKGETWSLGPCSARLLYTSSRGGWIYLACPGPALELSAGQSEKRRVDIPTGRLQITMDSQGLIARHGQFSLALEGGAAPLNIAGIQLDEADPSAAARTLCTAPIPPGSYRATLRPWQFRSPAESSETLAEFDITIRKNETLAVDLRR